MLSSEAGDGTRTSASGGQADREPSVTEVAQVVRPDVVVMPAQQFDVLGHEG